MFFAMLTLAAGLAAAAPPPDPRPAAEFDKMLAKFGSDVAEQKSKATANLDGLKQAMAVVGKDCGDCHKEFRKPQQ